VALHRPRVPPRPAVRVLSRPAPAGRDRARARSRRLHVSPRPLAHPYPPLSALVRRYPRRYRNYAFFGTRGTSTTRHASILRINTQPTFPGVPVPPQYNDSGADWITANWVGPSTLFFKTNLERRVSERFVAFGEDA